jgi:hypothetical protein
MNAKRKHKQTGPKGISEARLAAALRKNGGIQSAAARVLRIGRSAVCQRVAASPALQQAVRDGIKYDIYRDYSDPATFRASSVLAALSAGELDAGLGDKAGKASDVRTIGVSGDNGSLHFENKAIHFVMIRAETRARAV